ncbi:hypothetical protein ACP4J3_11160 [Streptomyces sp. UG1]
MSIAMATAAVRPPDAASAASMTAERQAAASRSVSAGSMPAVAAPTSTVVR